MNLHLTLEQLNAMPAHRRYSLLAYVLFKHSKRQAFKFWRKSQDAYGKLLNLKLGEQT